MLQMMKRDYHINGIYFLVVFLIFPFMYVFNLSPLFIYYGVIIGFIFNVFYYDGHNHVNRFVISLPVNRKTIVLSRYAFIYSVIVIYLLYLWLVDAVAHAIPPINWLPTIDYKPITTGAILLTFLAVTVIAAVSLPIYYFFQSFIKSLIAQGILFFGGIFTVAIFGRYLDLIPERFVLAILDLIAIQPVVFLIGFLAVCLVISYKISVRFFSGRDIV